MPGMVFRDLQSLKAHEIEKHRLISQPLVSKFFKLVQQ